MFLPWHRVYTQLMQYAIQICDPPRHANVTLPFWDPAVLNGSLSSWDGFSDRYFGGNGSDSAGCLFSGPFIGIKPYPEEHCIKRSMDLSLIQENIAVERMLGEFYGNPRSTAGFAEFTVLLETTLHAGVHAVMYTVLTTGHRRGYVTGSERQQRSSILLASQVLFCS